MPWRSKLAALLVYGGSALLWALFAAPPILEYSKADTVAVAAAHTVRGVVLGVLVLAGLVIFLFSKSERRQAAFAWIQQARLPRREVRVAAAILFGAIFVAYAMVPLLVRDVQVQKLMSGLLPITMVGCVGLWAFARARRFAVERDKARSDVFS